MITIVLLGSTGLLGSDLAIELKKFASVYAPGHSELDVTKDDLKNYLLKHQPDIVVNCVAFTNVDACETEQTKAHQLNAEFPKNLAEICADVGTHLIHFSTDYIFDGTGIHPWTENDQASPQSVYGLTKWLGERAIAAHTSNYTIFRIQWVYGKNGKNFVDTMVRILREQGQANVVSDQIGSICLTRDLARAVAVYIKKWADETVWPSGIYHLASEGYASWYEVAQEINRVLNLGAAISPVPTGAFPRPAVRPHNSRLNTQKLADLMGCQMMPAWQSSLKTYLLTNDIPLKG